MNVIAQAKEWLKADPHEETQHELRVLIEQAGKADPQALQELHDCFSGSLQFGTAGLRGKLGPGPNRMNLVVVARAAAGLAKYLNHENNTNNQGTNTVVIGYDARHNSELFAQVTAQILSGAGYHSLAIPTYGPYAGSGICYPAPARQRRCHGDREPQPTPRQWLQGVSRLGRSNNSTR